MQYRLPLHKLPCKIVFYLRRWVTTKGHETTRTTFPSRCLPLVPLDQMSYRTFTAKRRRSHYPRIAAHPFELRTMGSRCRSRNMHHRNGAGRRRWTAELTFYSPETRSGRRRERPVTVNYIRLKLVGIWWQPTPEPEEVPCGVALCRSVGWFGRAWRVRSFALLRGVWFSKILMS